MGYWFPHSACNTPILPVKKKDETWRLVQDLQIINEAIVPLHPRVPNLYVILREIPPSAKWFTVLDLKDAFFCITLAKKSQYPFAFEWEAPGEKYQQMTWTVLLQGFRDSPHQFGQALSQDLLYLDLGPNGKILLYVDGLLMCSLEEKNAQQDAIQVLNFLAERGYKVSHAKAKMFETKVIYLVVQITHRFRRLSSDPVQGILPLPSPTAWKELQAFLALTGYWRIWIPNHGLIAPPLHESLKGQDDSIPLMWGTPQKKAERKKVKSLSCVQLFATPWTVADQAPPSTGFSRQEYWSRLPFPSPGDLPDPGIKPRSPVLKTGSLPSEPIGKPKRSRGFSTLKQALTQAPSLRLLDPEKAFQLYVQKKEGIAIGVLT